MVIAAYHRTYSVFFEYHLMGVVVFSFLFVASSVLRFEYRHRHSTVCNENHSIQWQQLYRFNAGCVDQMDQQIKLLPSAQTRCIRQACLSMTGILVKTNASAASRHHSAINSRRRFFRKEKFSVMKGWLPFQQLSFRTALKRCFTGTTKKMPILPVIANPVNCVFIIKYYKNTLFLNIWIRDSRRPLPHLMTL